MNDHLDFLPPYPNTYAKVIIPLIKARVFFFFFFFECKAREMISGVPTTIFFHIQVSCPGQLI